MWERIDRGNLLLRCGLHSAGAVGSAARGASAPTQRAGEERGHIVAAARLQLVILHNLYIVRSSPDRRISGLRPGQVVYSHLAQVPSASEITTVWRYINSINLILI